MYITNFPPSAALNLCREISRVSSLTRWNGSAYLVGGCVRDAILELAPKDYDLELYRIGRDRVIPFLESVQPGIRIKDVGRSFPVWKVWNDTMGEGAAVDVALPRREFVKGPGHTDFEVVLDPFMSFSDAASRRDITINAMGCDPITGRVIDPHGGIDDLNAGLIRHVSHHFSEDPLRVLRIAQFAARFNMVVACKTIDLCAQLSPANLSRERIGEEWFKLILKGREISRGLQFLRYCGWMSHFPELSQLQGVQQDPGFHPEGDVWTHTLHCMDAFAETRTGNDREDLIVGLAALCHDLGKVSTTTIDENGKIHAYGHEEAGEEPTRSFLARLTDDKDLIESVVALVITHMIPTHLYKEATRGGGLKQMNRSVRRLATRVNLQRLARVVLIDKSGRPPKPKVSPESVWLLESAAALGTVTKGPEPILLGRHLVMLGLKPGLHFKPILESAMQRQLDGDILDLDTALEYARVAVAQTQST